MAAGVVVVIVSVEGCSVTADAKLVLEVSFLALNCCDLLLLNKEPPRRSNDKNPADLLAHWFGRVTNELEVEEKHWAGRKDAVKANKAADAKRRLLLPL